MRKRVTISSGNFILVSGHDRLAIKISEATTNRLRSLAHTIHTTPETLIQQALKEAESYFTEETLIQFIQAMSQNAAGRRSVA